MSETATRGAVALARAARTRRLTEIRAALEANADERDRLEQDVAANRQQLARLLREGKQLKMPVGGPDGMAEAARISLRRAFEIVGICAVHREGQTAVPPPDSTGGWKPIGEGRADRWVAVGAYRCDQQRRAAMSERLAVARGNDDDVCPNCGIWRVNAGYLKETCGADYRKPGCFVAALAVVRPPDPPDAYAIHEQAADGDTQTRHTDPAETNE